MDANREQFETWYKTTVSDWVKSVVVKRNFNNGRYMDGYVQKAWEGWQAHFSFENNKQNHFKVMKGPKIPPMKCKCGCCK